MIEKELLRQLGWSEALIDEITRVAGEVSQAQPMFPRLEQAVVSAETVSSGSIIYTGQPLNPTDQVM
jgi:hypothetical protein